MNANTNINSNSYAYGFVLLAQFASFSYAIAFLIQLKSDLIKWSILHDIS